MKNKISAVIITKNEEYNIRYCLESIKDFDEIVIVDDYSTDRTVEIAGEYTDKIFFNKFVSFSQQRNYAYSKAQNEWLFYIDADERMTPELLEEIESIDIENSQYDGYYIPHKMIFLNRWLKHGGWYPARVMRLFKKSKAKCVGLVHEVTLINGRTFCLKEPFIHYSERDIAHRVEKTNKYTSITAAKKYQNGETTNWGRILIKPLMTFIRRYLRLGGYKDGIPGLIRSMLLGVTTFFEEAKLWELHNVKSVK